MNALERVLTALSQREPDRVPFFLLLSLHGAKALGLSLQSYFSQSQNMVEGQLRLQERYGHDCIYGLSHAAVEHEAFGGEVLFFDDGPPNAGPPILRHRDDIFRLEPPRLEDCPGLLRVLDALSGLRDRVGGQIPIIGVAISPFSLPVMQLGFEAYLDLLLEDLPAFERLMQVNEAFSLAWANAQLAAGANAICYFDPVASPTCIPPALYRQTGFQVAQRCLPRISGPTATHMASGRALAILEDLIATGTQIVGVGPLENLSELKQAARGRISLLGNLNGVAMCGWSPQQAEDEVKRALAQAGPGGGFILSDHHGEIPWQVSDETLLAIAEAVRTHGQYPLHLENGG